MRKLRTALCLLGLALLTPAILRIQRALPLDSHALVEKKYDGWSGVLRLWVCEGWASGLSGWLNPRIAAFERAHEGVYVQPQYVDAAALAAMGESGIPAPELVLFPPGALETPEGLIPLEPPSNLRGALSDRGAWRGEIYAVPVAMGGYLWARDAALLPALPGTWQAAEPTPAAPEPEPFRAWDAALLALCAARYVEGAPPAAGGDWQGDVDLGLAPRRPTPSPTPAPTPAAGAACRLPEDFALSADALRAFANGKASAVPVTQREARWLQSLSDQGKGPDWRLDGAGAPFTDQLLCLAVPSRAEDDGRQALCLAFLAHLLSAESQGELHRMPAFSVTDAPSGYAAHDPLTRMEAALRDPALAAPRAFGGGWRETAAGLFRRFSGGAGEAPELWAALAAALR